MQNITSNMLFYIPIKAYVSPIKSKPIKQTLVCFIRRSCHDNFVILGNSGELLYNSPKKETTPDAQELQPLGFCFVLRV